LTPSDIGVQFSAIAETVGLFLGVVLALLE